MWLLQIEFKTGSVGFHKLARLLGRDPERLLGLPLLHVAVVINVVVVYLFVRLAGLLNTLGAGLVLNGAGLLGLLEILVNYLV